MSGSARSVRDRVLFRGGRRQVSDDFSPFGKGDMVLGRRFM